MKKILSLFLFLTICLAGISQITTSEDYDISVLVTDTLINGCTTASNVTVNNGAYGYFTKGNSSFPFESGIILSSGDISNAIGPNNLGGAGSNIGSGGDTDLSAIASSTINDATVLEFDFIPASDTIRFNYIFGSEEFPEYANTSYNDVFGFFLSGPGISGPYSNGAVNIALLPNGYPVTIDNIHDYNYYIVTPPDPNTHSPTPSACAYDNAVQYDGNSIVLTAEYVVTACETYHIKLAVADVSDSSLDSGVFIEAGSFISGASIEVVNNAQVGDAADLWEGCQNYYVVSREEGASTENEVVIDVMIAPESEAIEGEDFTDFPTQVVIEEGDMTDTIFYSAFNDGNEEGHETIIVMFYTACPCGNMSTAVYDTIWIYDAEFIKGGIQDVQTYYCGVDAPESITLVGECNIDPNVDYFWSTGEETNEIVVSPEPGATSYWLTMVDQCGNEVYDSITIRISDMEEVGHTLTNPSCYNQCDGYIQLNMEGEFEPFTYRYANSLYQYIPDSVHNSGMGTFGNLCPGTYKITATDAIGCFIRYEYTLDNPPPVNLSVGILESNMEFCENPGDIVLNAQSNQPDPIFLWSNSETTSSISVTPNVGENNYWVKIYDNCGNFYQDFISIKYSNLLASVSSEPDMGTCDGSASVVASDGMYPYTYYWQAPLSSFGSSQSDLCHGQYEVLVTDQIGCEISEIVTIEEHNTVPQSYYDDIFTVYPNPTTGKFTLNYKPSDHQNVEMIITDIQGKVVCQKSITESMIDFEDFNVGIYFIKLYQNQNIKAVQKLIVTE